MKRLLLYLFLLFPLLGYAQTEEQMEMARDYMAIIDDIDPEMLITELLSEYVLTPTEMTYILFQEEVYPGYKRNPKELISDLKNYGEKKFSRESIRDAIDHHFSHLDASQRLDYMNEVYETVGTPLSYWAGTYTFYITSMSGVYHPLIITNEGKISLEGVPVIHRHYDPEKSRLRIPTIKLRSTTPHMIIDFSVRSGRKFMYIYIASCPSCGILEGGTFVDR